jgi:hypothetical protein
MRVEIDGKRYISDDSETDVQAELNRLRNERDDTRKALRSLCERLGGSANDWPDDLHLADVVTKYVEEVLGDVELWDGRDLLS